MIRRETNGGPSGIYIGGLSRNNGKDFPPPPIRVGPGLIDIIVSDAEAEVGGCSMSSRTVYI